MYLALICRSYVTRHFYIYFARNAVSDSAEGNSNGSGIITVEELGSHYALRVCGKDARNEKLSCFGVFSGFAESSCSCCTATLCIDGRVKGAIHTALQRVCSSSKLVL